MRSTQQYFSDFFRGLGSLLTGMRITLGEFFTRKTTECYPENRKSLQMFERFRGELTLIHNEQNEHRCVACGICEMNCPNDTIHIESQLLTTEEGKKKKVLVRYMYDHGSCLYCKMCVKNCPHQALQFKPTFEHAVFTREKLIMQLNQPGSRLAGDKTQPANEPSSGNKSSN